jgi:hypothetical protein
MRNLQEGKGRIHPRKLVREPLVLSVQVKCVYSMMARQSIVDALSSLITSNLLLLVGASPLPNLVFCLSNHRILICEANTAPAFCEQGHEWPKPMKAEADEDTCT